MEYYDIPNDLDLNMSIIQDNKEEDYIFCSKIDENTLQFTDKINILKEMNYRDSYEHNICLEYDFLLNDIKKAYKDDYSIRQQFKIDLKRCDVYLNNHPIKDNKKIINYLDNKYNKELVVKIMMLTTQALLGLPFQIIFNNIIVNEYHLAEVNNNRESYKILINNSGKNIEFKAYKQFRIFKFNGENCINLYKVFIKLDFTLEEKSQVLFNIKINKY
uniref:Uncharacterized protein n=1 Tax=viral metagenome TaxID=1070528 RepID=A0A6C0EJV5_9ZZZZ